MKYISGQAFGMDPNQGRPPGRVAETQHYGLFDTGWVTAFETENPKVPETAREIGFSYLQELKRGNDCHQRKENPGFLS
jgi:hypothetical protein